MPSNRIGRINEEIQRELAALIRTVKDPRVHGLVSVTAVDTTPDLRYAKIYVSVLDKSDVKAVSYTHLDVYKRQISHHPVASQIQEKFKNEICQSCNVTITRRTIQMCIRDRWRNKQCDQVLSR